MQCISSWRKIDGILETGPTRRFGDSAILVDVSESARNVVWVYRRCASSSSSLRRHPRFYAQPPGKKRDIASRVDFFSVSKWRRSGGVREFSA